MDSLKTLDDSSEEHADRDFTRTACGWGKFQPKCLQALNRPACLLAATTWFTMAQGFVVNGIIKANTVTLERRFHLPSAKVGIIPSAYDLAAGILAIPISFVGMSAHKPRILALSSLVMAVGSFISVVPHLTVDRYQYGNGLDAGEYCQGNNTRCSEQTSGLSYYVIVFCLGNFLHGVGGSALYTLGAPLLDDNAPVKSAPLYIGIMYAGAGLGPALGYIFGGLVLDIYVDVDKMSPEEKIDLTPNDAGWVGAWWIGYVISGFLFLVSFVCFSLFGKETPDAATVRETRTCQAYSGNNMKEDGMTPNSSVTLRDFPKAFKIVLTNPVFILVTLAGLVEAWAISGFSVFIPKVMQNQFGVTASTGAIYAGIAVVPGAAGGHMLGGSLLRCLNLKVRGILRMCATLTMIGSLFGFVFLTNCSFPDIAGITVDYNNSALAVKSAELGSSCNQACNCSTAKYEPVCGSDRIQYFSACHAGCTTTTTSGGKTFYSNCSCVANLNSTERIAQTATPGGCGTSCHFIPLFLVFFFVIILMTFTTQNASLFATMRFIPDKQRTFALGIQWVVLRFLGTIPGPILMGKIFDSSCLVWQVSCEKSGACWIYDNKSLSVIFCVIAVSVKFTSSLFFVSASCVYKSKSNDAGSDTNERTAFKDHKSESTSPDSDISNM